ncbi:MAG: imidazole glycerol phosphate synthase subunit HisH [Lachnospiraceae bacterium]|nr:imidazole glycerol phosphate synthase subunit HisH [Lachnospiraceae bacterium]
MIAIIDYDAGNILSVVKAFQFLGEDVILTRDRDELLKADKLVLPGVGCFKDAVDNLRKYGLEPIIKECVEAGKPFLGICLGMQLLFEESEESPGVKGLSLLPGRCIKIPDDKGLKVPQIGWNSLSFPNNSRLMAGIPEGAFVYFVHSYYISAKESSDVSATTEYGVTVHAACERGNIFGCQFHPEKSSDVGLKILKNFAGL